MSSQLPTVQCSDPCSTPTSDFLTTIQFIGQGRLLAVLKGANLNTTNDQAISVPTGNWVLSEVIIANSSGTSVNAVGGIYDAVNKGGNQVVPNSQAYASLTGGASYETLTPSTYANANKFTASTVYFSLTTPEGSPLTADIFIYYWDLDPVEEVVTQATDCNCKRNFLIQHSGVNGTNGTDGIDGINAFTATTADFAMPAPAGTVPVSVLDTSWMVPGEIIFVQFAGYLSVSSITNSTTVVLNNVNYTGNAAPATNIPISSKVSPGGVNGPAGTTGATGPQGPAGTPGVATVHGQCRLNYDTGNLVLIPFNGNSIIIDGNAETIPAVGVTLAPGGLIVDTDYYIYAFMNLGTMTLEASVTGHSSDATTGVEIKTGDSTRSLVGFAHTIAGPAFSDVSNQRFVLSWFNRKPIVARYVLTSNVATSSATYVVLGGVKLEFIKWLGDGVTFGSSGAVSVNTATNYARTTIVIDNSGTPEDVYSENQAPNASANYRMGFGLSGGNQDLTEAYHFMNIFGLVDGGTGTWTGSGSAGSRSNFWVEVQG